MGSCSRWVVFGLAPRSTGLGLTIPWDRTRRQQLVRHLASPSSFPGLPLPRLSLINGTTHSRHTRVARSMQRARCSAPERSWPSLIEPGSRCGVPARSSCARSSRSLGVRACGVRRRAHRDPLRGESSRHREGAGGLPAWGEATHPHRRARRRVFRGPARSDACGRQCRHGGVSTRSGALTPGRGVSPGTSERFGRDVTSLSSRFGSDPRRMMIMRSPV